MTTVALLLGGFGVLLVWAALTGENPVAVLRDVLAGARPGSGGQIRPGGNVVL